MNKLSINDLPVYTELTLEQLKKLKGASGLAIAVAIISFDDSGVDALAIQVGTPTLGSSARTFVGFVGTGALITNPLLSLRSPSEVETEVRSFF